MDISLMLSKVKAIAVPIVEELGYEFVDIDFLEEEGEWYLRVYIDKEDGINIDDCALVSRPISDKLDEIDPIDIGYYFEVSSPGVNRIINKDSDFERFKEHKVILILSSPHEGKDTIIGVLKGLDGNDILIQYNKKLIKINRENVKSVNLNDI